MRNGEAVTDSADVVIVGGGVVGLSIARELGGAGARVVVVERGRLGREASHAAAGMLAPQAEADRADAFFEFACAGRAMYADFAAELEAETGVSIELDETGTLYLAFTDADEAEILHRYEWQTRIDLKVESLSGEEVRRREPAVSPHVRRALFFPLDAQVENRRLVHALTASAARRGVRLLCGTTVTHVCTERERICGVATSSGMLRASVVVIAAGAWSGMLDRMSADKSFIVATDAEPIAPQVEPVRGQMLCFAPSPPLVRHVIYSPRAYLVPRRDGRLLVGATTERVGFNKAVTAAGLHTLTAHALEIAPDVAALPFNDAWSGLRPRAADNLPIIGRSAHITGLIYATGHYRNGILLAPLTGKLIREMIVEEAHPPLLDSFTPARFAHSGYALTT